MNPPSNHSIEKILPRAVACLVTGRARAAIATIAIRGDGVSDVVLQNFTPHSKRTIFPGEVRYGVWHGPSHLPCKHAAESVVVTAIDSEPFENGEVQVSWEVHCHGGEVAAERILNDLSQSGVTVVDHSQWLMWSGKSLLEREAIAALSEVTTARTAAIVLDQARGAMQRFVDDTLVQLDNDCSTAIESARANANDILEFQDLGLHLTKPWTVVLAGEPNVGKSSLINALVGYRRSITMNEPGTTRDVLQADAVIDGWPMRLSDTAGLRESPGNDIERQGIFSARQTIQSVDLVLWILDSSRLSSVSHRSDFSSCRSIEVHNKIDLVDTDKLQIDEAIGVSATRGIGIELLRTKIVDTLISKIPPPRSPVPLTPRQVRALKCVAAVQDRDTLAAALRELRGE